MARSVDTVTLRTETRAAVMGPTESSGATPKKPTVSPSISRSASGDVRRTSAPSRTTTTVVGSSGLARAAPVKSRHVSIVMSSTATMRSPTLAPVRNAGVGTTLSVVGIVTSAPPRITVTDVRSPAASSESGPSSVSGTPPMAMTSSSGSSSRGTASSPVSATTRIRDTFVIVGDSSGDGRMAVPHVTETTQNRISAAAKWEAMPASTTIDFCQNGLCR